MPYSILSAIGRRVRSGRHAQRVLAVSLAAALALAACSGDDSDDSDEPAGTTEADAPAATDAPSATDAPASTEPSDGGDDDVAARLEVARAEPTTIPITEPLSGPVEPKSVAYIGCEVPKCATYYKGVREAADALGWEVTIIDGATTVPSQGWQQAFDLEPDFIYYGTAAPVVALEEQLAEAKDRGIPVFSCFGVDPATGADGNGIYQMCQDGASYEGALQAEVDWIVEDSGGQAAIVNATILDFPIQVVKEEIYQRLIGEQCTDCSFETLNLTIDDLLTGAIPGAITAYLQAHPDTKYVLLGWGDMGLGLPPTLEAAALDDIRIISDTPSESTFQDIADGAQDVTVTYPSSYTSWDVLDAMARVSLGQDFDERGRAAATPMWLVDDPEAAAELAQTAEGWEGPVGYEDAFKELWGVG